MISAAFKTPLEKRLGICIYKTLLLHRPDDHTGVAIVNAERHMRKASDRGSKQQ